MLILFHGVSHFQYFIKPGLFFNCKTKCRFYSPFTLTIVRLVLQTLSKTIESNNFHNKTTMNTKGHGCFYKDIIHLTIRHSGIDTPPNWNFHMLDKPANKKQVLFSKTFLLKISITNKPAFFIWFNKTYLPIFLLVHFHYSCIVYS